MCGVLDSAEEVFTGERSLTVAALIGVVRVKS